MLIQGQVEKSLEYLNRAEIAQREIHDQPGLARTLDRRATAHRFHGNYQASILDGMEALDLSEGDEALTVVQGRCIPFDRGEPFTTWDSLKKLMSCSTNPYSCFNPSRMSKI